MCPCVRVGVFVCVFVSVCMCVVCMLWVCCVGGCVGVWLGAHFSFCSLQEGSNRVLTVSQGKFCADGNIAGTQLSISRMTEM